MRQLLALLALVLGLATATAQHPMLRNYGTDDYQGGTQNWAIDITGSNRVVMANNSGLLRYDSRWWRRCPLSNNSNVRSILYDSLTNHIWAGGTDEFGCFEYDPLHVIHYHSVSEGLAEGDRQFGEIWNIMRCGADFIFQAKSHLFFLHKDSTLSVRRTPFTIESSAIVGGELLVADETGVYRVGPDDLTPLPGMEPLRGMNIRALLPRDSSQLIICTATGGLFLYESGGQARPFCPDLTSFLSESRLFCATLKGDLLAIGTVRKGLAIRNLADGSTQYANTETGLANNTVLSLHFDQTDNLWAGLDQGLAYVMPTFPATSLLPRHSHIGAGYASALVADRLYLGTNQGLFTMPYSTQGSPTPRKPQPVDGIAGQIWRLTPTPTALLCASDAGTFIVRGEQARKVSGPEGTWCLLPLRSHPEYVLGCDYSGLFLLRSSDLSFAGRVEGFGESSASLLEDADGSIWMGHWRKGIYRLTLSPDAHKVESAMLFNKSNGLLVDEENRICQISGRTFVSSVDGFYSYDAPTGTLKHDKGMSHVFNTFGQALRVTETPGHDLWAYKPGYLAIAHPIPDGGYRVDTLSYKGIAGELQMGLGHPGFIAGSDLTVINSLSGFLVVDNHAATRYQNSRLKIETVSSTNHGDTLLYACSSRNDVDAYRVEHAYNSLRISFVMPEYLNPDEIVYSCLLQGYDHDWSQWQTSNVKDYTHLPRGRYTFRVKALNRMTGFTDERAITVEVLPAWYESWWAHLLYFLLAAAAAGALTLLVRRRQARRLRELEARKEEELRAQQQRFALEQQQMEMEQQRQENELARQENELTRMRNEQLETELKHHQSQLADSTMNLMRKNDMLQALDEQMGLLSESVRREDAKASITKRIKDIRHDIQQNINEDEGWDKFEENFNLVYENFMKRLVAQFPDLKMSDRKLCAYLRMGLSSKEMASLLNTSVRSIETARYRLRKKLGMEQGDNLAEFIQTFGA